MKKSAGLSTRPNWLILGVLTAIGAIVFFQPYIGAIAIAILMAYLFFPVFTFLSKKMKPGLAAPLTLVISILIAILPIGFLAVLAISQGIQLATWLASLGTAPNDALTTGAHPIVDTVNAAFTSLSGQPVITVEGIQQFVKEVIPALIQGFVAIALSLAGSLPILLSSAIIYGFLFNSLLLYRGSLIEIIKTLSPFEAKTSDLYLERAGSIVKASLVGQLAISFVTAVLSAWLLFLVGLQSYFLFFVIIFTILGMVPLGAGILVIPIALIAMLTGQFWAGLWVLLIFILVICNIDSFMRPHFMPKNARLLPAFTTLAAFCGIYYFGFLGIVYGPLIVILILTTIEIYASTKTGTQVSLFVQPPAKKPRRRFFVRRKTVV